MLVGYWVSLRQDCSARDNSFGKCCFPFSLRFDRAFAWFVVEGNPPPREGSVAAGAGERHRSPAAVFSAICGTPVDHRFSCLADCRHLANVARPQFSPVFARAAQRCGIWSSAWVRIWRLLIALSKTNVISGPQPTSRGDLLVFVSMLAAVVSIPYHETPDGEI